MNPSSMTTNFINPLQPQQQMNFNQLLTSNIKWTPELITQRGNELSKKINEDLNQIQKNKSINNQAQLESFNINLRAVDKYFTPEGNTNTNQKSLGQLYALSTNLRKNLQDKFQGPQMANLFLSNHGITLAKSEKEISDLSQYIQNRYDLTSEMKKVPISEKFSFNDINKFTQKIQTDQIRKNINENVKYNPNLKKKKYSNFYGDLVSQHFNEVGKLKSVRIDENVEMGKYEKTHKYDKYDYDKYSTYRQDFGTSKRSDYNITPIKTKNFETGLKIKSDFKQTSHSTGVMLNNLNKNINQVNLNEDENILATFDNYFNTLKPYFYYKMKGEVANDMGGFLFNQNEINKFNQIKDKKSNFVTVSISINELNNNFEKMNDHSRRSIFDLLKHQLNPTETINSGLNVNKMLTQTANFYEKEFLKKIINSSFEDKLDFNNLDYKSKINQVDNYVNSVIYEKFYNKISYDSNNLENLRIWGNIFYLLRSGMEIELMKYFQTVNIDKEIEYFQLLFTQFYKDEPIDYELYTHFLEKVKKVESELNPFRHCCYVLITRVNHPINENILDSLEDYIWFHLKLIVEKPNFEKLKSQKNPTAKFITLKEFQDFMKRTINQSLENSYQNIHLDHLKCLFSLLLFEDGLNYLSNKNEHLIDSVNISFLLKEINLLRNFHNNNSKENILTSNYDHENDYFIKNLMDRFTETFMNSRFFPILFYIKFNYSNLNEILEKVANVFMTTGKYSSLINLNENQFIFKEKIYYINDLFNKQEISSIVSNIISYAVSSMNEVKGNFNLLVKLAKTHKMYSELLELISNDCVEIITGKTPQRIFKSEIHSKPSIVDPSKKVYTDTRYEKSIGEKYKDILEEIGANIQNYDNKFRINFKFLRQLETIEEIYDMIFKDNFSKALDTFIKYVTIIPFKNEKDVQSFMNNDYIQMNEQIKKVIPDIVYLLFTLLSRKLNELNTSFNMRRNDNFQTSKSDIELYKSYINNISNFIEHLSSSKVLRNSEKYREITKMINDFSLKF